MKISLKNYDYIKIIIKCIFGVHINFYMQLKLQLLSINTVKFQGYKRLFKNFGIEIGIR